MDCRDWRMTIRSTKTHAPCAEFAAVRLGSTGTEDQCAPASVEVLATSD